MTRFGFTQISLDNSRPIVTTSEPNDLQVTYKALQALIPSARMMKSNDYSWTQIPQMVSATFDRLDGKDHEVQRWLGAKFADLGWEPFESIFVLRKAFD